MKTDIREEIFSDKVLGHPSALFVLFFTEMWERFSFYGMRVLLVNFLTMTLIGYNPGWEWTAENAGALFGTYAMLLYITPIAGGIIADKYTGYRTAVIIGAIIMTLGHASMALETELGLYLGLALLVIGTGFFKPNITSMISEMYKGHPEKKDGAFTIFYMGVNAGAFFGMMLCGYLAERVGWSWGFGLAGIFMLLGTLQFAWAKRLFGDIGAKPLNELDEDNETPLQKEVDPLAKNPFTTLDKILIVICSVIGLMYAINDPLSKIGGIDLFKSIATPNLEGQYVAILVGLGLFLVLVISRISRYTPVVRDRMIAFIIFAFFTVFFWMSFEQGASSLVIFARDNVNRVMEGSAALTFNIINALLTLIPLFIITYVLYLLGKRTGNKIKASNITLVVCFALVWMVVIWMLNRDFNTTAYEVSYPAIEEVVLDDDGNPKLTEDGTKVTHMVPVTTGMVLDSAQRLRVQATTTSIGQPFIDFKDGQKVNIINKDKEKTNFGFLDDEKMEEARRRAVDLGRDNGIIEATIVKAKKHYMEITVSWFSILNSFFIIVFASLISKWWESKYNPPAAVKYGLGLIIMAIGFGLLAWGSTGAVDGVKVSMIWLILAYLFHTLGELCLSPVGLSYVSKLVPPRMIALMFGMWYLAIAIGNKLAAILGGKIEKITEEYSLTYFFLIFTIVPAIAGVLVMLLHPLLKRLMHGVK